MKLLKRLLGHLLQAPMRLLKRMNVLGSRLVCDNKKCKVLKSAHQGKVTRAQAKAAVKAVKPPMRTIKRAPVKGKIPRADIEKAVKAVSKKRKK